MNDVNIIGYINSKPNMKQKDGQTTVNFLISPRHKKDTPVEFIPCIVFGKYAESVFQYIHKGRHGGSRWKTEWKICQRR